MLTDKTGRIAVVQSDNYKTKGGRGLTEKFPGCHSGFGVESKKAG